jgi:SAM-dependent methyltransferase
MDEATVGYLSYRWHEICNPYTLDHLQRTLAHVDLKAGDRAVDVGAGNGFTAAWLANRYGLEMTAVERHPTTAGLTRDRAARVEAPGRMQVVEAYSHDHLAGAGEHRLVSVIGALDIFPGGKTPPEVMKAIAPSVAPGGWLLWGDPYWKARPGPRLATFFAEHRFADLAGWVKAGEAAGLVSQWVTVTGDADWEYFVFTISASLEAWAAENPTSPDAMGVRMRAAMTRSLYLEEGRDAMGFALMLFRRPA